MCTIFCMAAMLFVEELRCSYYRLCVGRDDICHNDGGVSNYTTNSIGVARVAPFLPYQTT